MQNMERNQSEIARKEIEMEFGLIKAGKQEATKGPEISPLNARKLNSILMLL